MFFLNEMEIDEYAARNVPGARILQAFKDMVNQNSDGWPYWAPACRAAKQLQQLVSAGNPYTHISDVQIRKALVPMKRFCTRDKLPKDWANVN